MPGTIYSKLRCLAATFLCGIQIGISQITSGGNPATTPIPRAIPWWVQRHADKVAEAQRGNVNLLFLGDSITQNYENPGPPPGEAFLPIWNDFFAPHQAMNLGFSGDETGHVLWRLQNGEVQGLSPRDVVLLIGTNNTARGQRAPQVELGIIACVEEIHRLLPHARILLLAILPSGISLEKSAADRAINKAIEARYAASPFVRTLDLSSLFAPVGILDPTLFYDPELHPAQPPLHPNSVGQRRMAQAISAALYPAHRPKLP